MNRPTAVAAPPLEPFEDLFAFIDQMPVRDLPVLAARIRRRHGIVVNVRTTFNLSFNDVLAHTERWHHAFRDTRPTV